MGAKNIGDELSDGFRFRLSGDEMPVGTTSREITRRVLKDLGDLFFRDHFAATAKSRELAEKPND